MTPKLKKKKVWVFEAYEFSGECFVEHVQREICRSKVYDNDKKIRITVEEL